MVTEVWLKNPLFNSRVWTYVTPADFHFLADAKTGNDIDAIVLGCYIL